MDKNLKEKIEKMIKLNKIFLFMKGTPENPMCGFSMRVSEILESLNVKFKSFDVLSDNSIREGIKEYSTWPTIPQLFINGKFIGGADIVAGMVEKGELQKLLK